jgi:hypothetical protein
LSLHPPESRRHVAVSTGAGKSHLAAALGLALVEKGWRVLVTRTTDLEHSPVDLNRFWGFPFPA